MTTGMNTAAMRSARSWMGARAARVRRTRWTIWARRVPAPTATASSSTVPDDRRVPAKAWEPGARATGRDSPVRDDVSAQPSPSTTRPSTGIRPPWRTRTRSPGDTASRAVSRQAPSTSTSAPGAESCRRPATALRALRRAPPSMARPTTRRDTSMEAVSKYTWWVWSTTAE